MHDLNIGDEIVIGGIYESIALVTMILKVRHNTPNQSPTVHLVFVKINDVPAASVVSVCDALVVIGGTGADGIVIAKSMTPVFSSDGLYAPSTLGMWLLFFLWLLE